MRYTLLVYFDAFINVNAQQMIYGHFNDWTVHAGGTFVASTTGGTFTSTTNCGSSLGAFPGGCWKHYANNVPSMATGEDMIFGGETCLVFNLDSITSSISITWTFLAQFAGSWASTDHFQVTQTLNGVGFYLLEIPYSALQIDQLLMLVDAMSTYTMTNFMVSTCETEPPTKSPTPFMPTQIPSISVIPTTTVPSPMPSTPYPTPSPSFPPSPLPTVPPTPGPSRQPIPAPSRAPSSMPTYFGYVKPDSSTADGARWTTSNLFAGLFTTVVTMVVVSNLE